MNSNDFDSGRRSNTALAEPPERGAVVTPNSLVDSVSSQPRMESSSYPPAPPTPSRNLEYISEPIPHTRRDPGHNPLLVAILVAIGMLVILGLILWITSVLFVSTVSETETHSVAQGDAKSVAVDVSMGVGNLSVSGGAANLMDATFTYNAGSLKPNISYKVDVTKGALLVQQPSTNILSAPSDIICDWKLGFNSQVPMTMKAALGTGPSYIRLSGLSLTRLEVNSGAGDGTVNLAGRWNHDADVIVNGGAGQITLIIPNDTGVRITTAGGPGTVRPLGLTVNGSTYTNVDYGKAPHTVNIDVKLSTGDVHLIQMVPYPFHRLQIVAALR